VIPWQERGRVVIPIYGGGWNLSDTRMKDGTFQSIRWSVMGLRNVRVEVGP
jgi:hypothetical protein